MDNLLAAEQPIIQRIQQLMPELAGVFAAADLDGVAESKQITPAVHVLYFGDVPVEGSGRSNNGEVQTLDQLWYAVLVVKNVRQQGLRGGEESAVRSAAGPLAYKLSKALQGFAPTLEHTPLRRVKGVAPGFKAGYAYIPLLFSTRITI